MKTCYEANFAGFPVVLQQYRGRDLYRVTYGAQVDRDLSYSAAAKKLGEAIMHGLQCEGRLDPDEGDAE